MTGTGSRGKEGAEEVHAIHARVGETDRRAPRRQAEDSSASRHRPHTRAHQICSYTYGSHRKREEGVLESPGNVERVLLILI